MSKITGIGIALLLVICVPKILSFYDISLSAYGPYLAFLVFIVILAFILPHNFLVTVDTVANAATNISEGSDTTSDTTTNATSNAEGLGIGEVQEISKPMNLSVKEGGRQDEFEGGFGGGRQDEFGVTERVTGGGSQYNNNNSRF